MKGTNLLGSPDSRKLPIGRLPQPGIDLAHTGLIRRAVEGAAWTRKLCGERNPQT